MLTVVLILVCFSTEGFADHTADEIDAALRKVVAENDYQTALPEATLGDRADTERAAPDSVTPPQADSRRESQRRQDPGEALARPTVEPDETVAAGPNLMPVFWIAVAVIVAFLVAYWAREIWIGARREPTPAAARHAQPNAPARRPSPKAVSAGEIDLMAQRGDYRAATRALLIRCVDSIVSRSTMGPKARSYTNRELGGAVDLPPTSREAFLTLIGAEEMGQFGAYPLSESTYRKCLSAFQTVESDLREGTAS